MKSTESQNNVALENDRLMRSASSATCLAEADGSSYDEYLKQQFFEEHLERQRAAEIRLQAQRFKG